MSDLESILVSHYQAKTPAELREANIQNIKEKTTKEYEADKVEDRGTPCSRIGTDAVPVPAKRQRNHSPSTVLRTVRSKSLSETTQESFFDISGAEENSPLSKTPTQKTSTPTPMHRLNSKQQFLSPSEKARFHPRLSSALSVGKEMSLRDPHYIEHNTSNNSTENCNPFLALPIMNKMLVASTCGSTDCSSTATSKSNCLAVPAEGGCSCANTEGPPFFPGTYTRTSSRSDLFSSCFELPSPARVASPECEAVAGGRFFPNRVSDSAPSEASLVLDPQPPPASIMNNDSDDVFLNSSNSLPVSPVRKSGIVASRALPVSNIPRKDTSPRRHRGNPSPGNPSNPGGQPDEDTGEVDKTLMTRYFEDQMFEGRVQVRQLTTFFCFLFLGEINL